MGTTREGLVRVLQTVVQRHQELSAGLADRAADVERAAFAHHKCRPPINDLVEFVTRQVLPYASLEEDTLYAAGRAMDELGDVLSHMADEHGHLTSTLSSITSSADVPGAVRASRELVDTFLSHVAEEDRLVLPQVLASADLDVARFVAHTERLARYNWANAVLDLRGLDPPYCHRLVFERFEALPVGRTFMLAGDSHSELLRYQLGSRYGDEATWELVELGPFLWRARVGRLGPKQLRPHCKNRAASGALKSSWEPLRSARP